MTHAAQELSQRGSQKVYLYQVTFQGNIFRFTNAEVDLTLGGLVFRSETITHGDTSRTLEEDAEQLIIQVPVTNFMAQLFLSPTPAGNIDIVQSSYHRTDVAEEQQVEFRGRIRIGTEVGDGMMELVCKSVIADLSKEVPRETFQGPCNNFLYDSRCKVNENLFTHNLNVALIDGRNYTINGLAAVNGAADFFEGGFIQVNNGVDQRMILQQNGDVVTLMLPFPSTLVSVGTEVEVKVGCDHTLATCNSKFGNAINYGGFPYVPDRNPFATGVQ